MRTSLIVPTLCFSLASALGQADPAPFGLELGTTTVDQAAELYRLHDEDINRYSNGPMFELDVAEIEFDGLTSVTLIFDQQQVLVAVLAELPKNRFEDLFDLLSNKYRLVDSRLPFVGNQYAEYVDGDTEITLEAPHLSFDMKMNYVRRSLLEAFEREVAREQSEKSAREASQL